MPGIKVNRPNISSTPSNYINPRTHLEDGSEHVGVQRKASTPDTPEVSSPDMGFDLDVGNSFERSQEQEKPEQGESRSEAWDTGRSENRTSPGEQPSPAGEQPVSQQGNQLGELAGGPVGQAEENIVPSTATEDMQAGFARLMEEL